MVGIVAGSYDDAEIWEVAAMLGANDPPEGAGDTPGEVLGDPLQFLAG